MIPAERITSYQVWAEILGQHPEISLVSTDRYSLKPERIAGDLGGEHEPNQRNYYEVEEVRRSLPRYSENDETGTDLNQELKNEPYAVHSIVGIGRYWEQGPLPYVPEMELTFLFVDFDIPVSEVNEQMIDEVIKEMGIKGYLLRSDYSYHFVSDELTTLDKLPLRYGKLINAFAGEDSRWGWVREIGDALINAEEYEEVKKICYDILAKVDHYGVGDKYFMVDLRNVAHSLLGIPTLRISSKEGVDYPPILIKKYDGRRKRGLEPIGKIIEESDIFCWMKPPAPKSA